MKINRQGYFGEYYVGKYLRARNYNIFTNDYYSKYGEIDIVATDEEKIYFIEVKTRKISAIAEPKEAVDELKQKRIILASQYFLKEFPFDLQIQYDVAEVLIDDNFNLLKINYIKNAY